MTMNVLDIILLIILAVTLILGLIKGLVRGIIGVIAVIVGLILAAHYYVQAGVVFHVLISSTLVSNFLGFLVIFGTVLLAGWLIGFLLSKLMKGPLAFVNHVLGGVFGLLKGVLICGVVVFALLVFEVGRGSLKSSRLAPFCFQAARAAVQIIPKDLKEKFKAAYEDLRKDGESHGQKI